MSHPIDFCCAPRSLLSSSAHNKGTAFTHAERLNFHLSGYLPHAIENLDTQVQRAYAQYQKSNTPDSYLHNVLSENHILFYALLKKHIQEMLPVIYTPGVGERARWYSHCLERPEGLYLAYPERDRLASILDHRPHQETRLIVVTDGEAILGIGDQGIGGMAIAVAKLIVYSLFGGIHPRFCLPVFLDVGTNNAALLEDPLYLGWRHPRIDVAQHEEFMEQFVHTVQKKIPHVFLHYEDFSRERGAHYLKKYEDHLCVFNDDIQGTGVAALAAVLNACQKTNTPLETQRIVVFGGGSAGMGIASHIHQFLCDQGMSPQDAYGIFWIVDRHGLITPQSIHNTIMQLPFARSDVDWNGCNKEHIGLLEVVKNVHPTILIGTSAQAGSFTEEMVRIMAHHVERPVILPLSNPNACSEAQPKDLVEWTEGRCLIATGSRFEPIDYKGTRYVINQCNNCLAFPGIGLGVLISKARCLNNAMLHAASLTLSQCTHQEDVLLPHAEDLAHVSLAIALAVAKAAIHSGSSVANTHEIQQELEQLMWNMQYESIERQKPLV